MPGAKCERRLRTLVALSALALMVLVPSARARTNGSAPPLPKTTPREVANGKAAFDQHCEICHYDESTAQKIGPGLKGLYTRTRFAGGRARGARGR